MAVAETSPEATLSTSKCEENGRKTDGWNRTPFHYEGLLVFINMNWVVVFFQTAVFLQTKKHIPVWTQWHDRNGLASKTGLSSALLDLLDPFSVGPNSPPPKERSKRGTTQSPGCFCCQFFFEMKGIHNLMYWLPIDIPLGLVNEPHQTNTHCKESLRSGKGLPIR